MTKLALLALTITTLISISAVSAYKTTITTTTIEEIDNGVHVFSDDEQCTSPTPIEKLDNCVHYLSEGNISGEKLKMVVNRRSLQQEYVFKCCGELMEVSYECLCPAIQLVFDEARVNATILEVRQMLSKAQVLPTYCRLGARSCPIISPRV